MNQNHRSQAAQSDVLIGLSKLFPQSWQACVEQMLDRVAKRLSLGQLPVMARRHLEAMPLASEDYGVALARLINVRIYAEDSQWGAAAFELRLLQAVGRRPVAPRPRMKNLGGVNNSRP